MAKLDSLKVNLLLKLVKHKFGLKWAWLPVAILLALGYISEVPDWVFSPPPG